MEATANGNEKLTLMESLKILFGASKVFWLVNLVNFADGIAYFGILTLLTRFLGTRLGMPDAMVGISVSAFTGLVTLFMFGGGFISDKLGVRNALTLSLLMLLGGRVFTVIAPYGGESYAGWSLAWLGLMLMAFGSGVLQPALYAGTKEYTDPRTATIGYSLLYAIMNLGIMAEGFISPFVRTDEHFLGGFNGLGWGIDGVFWVCVTITGLVTIAHLALFTRSVDEKCRWRDPNAKAEPQKPAADEAPKTWKDKLMELPFLDARFMFFIFILLPVRTLFAHQFLTMPDYVFRCFPAEVGAKFEWINALNPTIIVIFVPLIAALTREVSVITMMIIGSAMSAVTTFILVPGPDLNMLILYVLLFSLGEALWSSRFLEYVADLAPEGKVGAYMGLAGIPWFLAKFTTGLYSGFMLSRFVPAPPDMNGIYDFFGVPQSLGSFFMGSWAEAPLNEWMKLLVIHDSSTLWLIYGFIACISPIGLILARGWIEKGAHHGGKKAEAA